MYGALVDGEPIHELHQRRRRAGFRRVDRAGDVVDRRRRGRELVSASASFMSIVRGSASFARAGAVGVELRDQFASDDTATAIISRPSSVLPIENTFTRGLAFSSMPHVLVDLARVGQDARRAGDVASAPRSASARSSMPAGSRPAAT